MQGTAAPAKIGPAEAADARLIRSSRNLVGESLQKNHSANGKGAHLRIARAQKAGKTPALKAIRPDRCGGALVSSRAAVVPKSPEEAKTRVEWRQTYRKPKGYRAVSLAVCSIISASHNGAVTNICHTGIRTARLP
jgi:hypothetical protein